MRRISFILGKVILTGALISIFPLSEVGAQKTGHKYLVKRDEYFEFPYERKYIEKPDTFITVYTGYHPKKGHPFLKVTATHYRQEKRVEVKLENPQGGLFAFINEEEVQYDSLTTKPFGKRGSAGVIGGKRVPDRIRVHFISERYENVNVLEVLGRHTKSPEYYVLDGGRR